MTSEKKICHTPATAPLPPSHSSCPRRTKPKARPNPKLGKGTKRQKGRKIPQNPDIKRAKQSIISKNNQIQSYAELVTSLESSLDPKRLMGTRQRGLGAFTCLLVCSNRSFLSLFSGTSPFTCFPAEIPADDVSGAQ